MKETDPTSVVWDMMGPNELNPLQFFVKTKTIVDGVDNYMSGKQVSDCHS